MSDVRQRIVMATGNQGKLAEIRQLLADLPVEIVPQSDFDFEPAEEVGVTFAENAVLKARAATLATGLIAIADDSGIAVDALDGRPGVRTARYAGENATNDENVSKLLEELEGVPAEKRGAAFHCVVAVTFPDPEREPLLVDGRWHGQIAQQRHGDGGFGYDPVFYDPGLAKCAAEMAASEKNARSHRGQAFRKLVKQFDDLL